MKIEYDLMQLLLLHSFQYNNSAKINLCNANFTYWVKYFAIKMLRFSFVGIYQEKIQINVECHLKKSQAGKHNTCHASHISP